MYEGVSEKFRDRLSRVSEDIGSPRMKYLISQLDCYAGARMHSTIASLSTKVPTISLAYSQKGEALNKILFGHSNWVIKIPEFTTNGFCEKLRELLTQKNFVKRELDEKIPQLKQRAFKAGEHLKKLMK